MTTRLLLISHASTPALRAARFPLDEPLDEDGAARAAALQPLVGSSVDRALCGPCRRTVETASALGLVAVVEPALRDLDVGVWAGRTIEELLANEPGELATWMTDPSSVPHGGESVAALIDRVRSWLASLGDGERIVAVTHPAVVRACVLGVVGGPAGSFWSIDVSPFAMVRLHCTGGRWRIRFDTPS